MVATRKMNIYRGVAQFGRVLGSGPRGRRFKSSHSDQQKTKAFCLRFLLQEENLKSSVVNDSLGRLSEPSVTERRRAARIKSSHSDQQKTKAFCLRFLLQEENLKSSVVNDSLGRLSEPSVTERRRAARIKSSHSDGQKTKAFCLRFFVARRGFEKLGSE